MATDPKINKSATQRPPDAYYLGWILKIAAAATVELPEASQAVYLEQLRQLSQTEIQMAARRTIREWQEPSKMPTISFILARKTSVEASYDEIRARQLEARSREILGRADKPPGWEELGRKVGVAPSEIAEWLEAGKEQQREHIARLHDDPEWRKIAKRFGAKI